MELIKKYWWVGALLAAAAVGAFLWKNRKHDDTTTADDETVNDAPGHANHQIDNTWSINPGKNTDTTIIKQELKGPMYPADAGRIADAMGATAFFFPSGNGYIEYKMKGPFVKNESYGFLSNSYYKQYNGTLYTKNGA